MAKGEGRITLKERIKLGLAILIVAFGLIGLVLLNTYRTNQAINSNNHKWCQTLILLTKHPASKPANPKANPSREALFEFDQSLIRLKIQYHC